MQKLCQTGSRMIKTWMIVRTLPLKDGKIGNIRDHLTLQLGSRRQMMNVKMGRSGTLPSQRCGMTMAMLELSRRLPAMEILSRDTARLYGQG